MQSVKKRQEIWLLERFKELYPEFPAGTVVPHEKPDFLIETEEGAVVGIEVREWFYDENLEEGAGGSPSRREESLNARIVQRSQKLYSAWNLPEVDVGVNFHSQCLLKEKQLETLAAEIAGIVAKHVPSAASQFEAVRDPEPGWKDLPLEVVSLFIYRPPAGRDVIWAAEGGGILPTVTARHIEEAIRAKEPLLAKYRESANLVWLLIAAAGFNTSGFCEVDPELGQHRFNSAFDQVFFLQAARGILLQLNVGENTG
jgi:hypothetical protein